MSSEILAEGTYEIHRWSSRLELHKNAPETRTILAEEKIGVFQWKPEPHPWKLTRNKDGTYFLLNGKSDKALYLAIDGLNDANHVRVLGMETPQKWVLKPFGTQDRFYIVLAGQVISLNGELFELVVDLPNWDHPKTALKPLEPGQISQTWVFMKVS